jgi:hypothetical protein
VIRPPAHDARPVPAKLAALGHGVGLFVDLRVAVGRAEEAEILAAGVGFALFLRRRDERSPPGFCVP